MDLQNVQTHPFIDLPKANVRKLSKLGWPFWKLKSSLEKIDLVELSVSQVTNLQYVSVDKDPCQISLPIISEFKRIT